MYEPPPQEERPGCRDVWLLTGAAFAVLLLPLLALAGALGALLGALVLFAIHPALALLPVAALALAVYLFARWEQGRNRPPQV